MDGNAIPSYPIQSTAGAVPMVNEKGEVTMQKVKVARYVTGKRPDYAPEESSDEEFDERATFHPLQTQKLLGSGLAKSALKSQQSSAMAVDEDSNDDDISDPRLRRLKEHQRDRTSSQDNLEERHRRHRQIHRPEVIAEGESSSDDDEAGESGYRAAARHVAGMDSEESSEEEEELDEDEIERRRALMRQHAQLREEVRGQQQEVMEVEEEASEQEEEAQSSDYEEYTDSEEETGPRLKPIFVSKKDRITIQEKKKEEAKQKEIEQEAKLLAEERRKYSIKMVEEAAKQELTETKAETDPCDAINTDDENDDDEEYEAWKVRELKRIKRDRDEREAIERDRLELDRLHTMTEEERRAEQRLNPKVITNKSTKGKYKFLQKYYHRGAFYLDKEDQVLKKDFSGPTLEDHFDKTILPKVMQVKNFGRSGRTKYTHLVDQDTTQFDSPWASDTAANLKWQTSHAAGMKQNFEKPTASKRNKTST